MKLNPFEFLIVNNPLRRFIQSTIEIKGFLGVPNYVKGGRVLEIGCGNGYGTILINKYFKPKEIHGIDLDERMIKLAKKNKLSNTSFNVGDATKLDFKGNSLDGIFIFAVLHHVPDWKKALDEIYRVLKKRGQVFIEDASLETFSTPFGLIMKRLTNHPYTSMYKLHEFFDYFDKLGFKTIKKRIYRPLGLTSRFVIIGRK